MRSLLPLLSLLLLPFSGFSQKLQAHEFKRGDFRIMFYNAENLFDTENDSLKKDDDFTPEGLRRWTPKRYYKKLNNIAQVAAAIGQWELPEIIGLCEIENRKVLQDLIHKTHLKKFPYRIVHKESPDKRGIDVAFLYRKDKFQPIDYEAVKIEFPFSEKRPTRDILYVKGILGKTDTLHIFVNHWPSRWGGETETERKRVFAASVLLRKTDSLFSVSQNPNILIMGDLNDYPTNNSLLKTLQAKTKYNNPQNGKLYNLAWYLQEKKGKGTHKHEGNWGVLDQIIVSGALLNKSSRLSCSVEDVHTFDAPFLLEPDEHFIGNKPFRTYIGFKFHNGYSDHLPVYIDLYKNKKPTLNKQ